MGTASSANYVNCPVECSDDSYRRDGDELTKSNEEKRKECADSASTLMF